MNKTALQDIQKTLNIIRNQIDAVDADTKWAVLELMLASSASVAALSKKMTKPDTKQSLAQSLFPKQKSSNSLLSKQANPLRTTQLGLLSNPPLPKNRYPINKPANQHLKIID